MFTRPTSVFAPVDLGEHGNVGAPVREEKGDREIIIRRKKAACLAAIRLSH